MQIGIFGASVTLQSTPSTLPETGGELELVALVRDEQGLPLAGAVVNFSTDVGVLASGGGFIPTDEDGSATDTLIAGEGELTIVPDDSFDVTVELAGADGGLLSAATSVTIQRRPVAAFSVSSSGTSLFVNFTDLSTGRPTSWQWDFGDGNTSRLQNPSHTYASRGGMTYSVTVTLTISNTVGVDSRSQSFEVGGTGP